MNVKHEELTVRALYDLSYTAARPLLEACTYPWEALPKIGEFIKALGKTLSPEEYEQRGEDVWVAKSAKLYPNVYIAGPTVIGPETEVRPGAFIRGNALIGAGCVVGNSTEVKNAILFDGAQAPHYNYIGDSVMRHKARGRRHVELKAGSLKRHRLKGRRTRRDRHAQIRRHAGRPRRNRLRQRFESRHGRRQKRTRLSAFHGARLRAREPHL